MARGSTYVEDYVGVDYDAIRHHIKASKYTQNEVCTICGHNPAWLSNNKAQNSKMHKADIEKLTALLKITPDEITGEADQRPEKNAQAVADSDVVAELKAISSALCEVLEILKKATQEEEKIPLSKRERAVSILRKSLIGKNGGGVKYEEFKKLLAQAGIGSAYASDAINECDCHTIMGNNGIKYIVTNEIVKA